MKADPVTTTFVREQLIEEDGEPIDRLSLRSKLLLATGRQVNERMIRLSIAQLRAEGLPIVAGDSGYFIATDPEDVDRFVNREAAKARSILRMIAALRKVPLGEAARQMGLLE